MADHEPCDLGLGLALAGAQHVSSTRMDLSFTLCRKTEDIGKMNRKVDEAMDEDEQQLNCSNSRKKLRLTKEQSSLLEDSFKLHSTLTPGQKQTLANQLDLKPRQVEVWFQNRRARTKLKQTEVNYEILKKRCETLGEENRKMKKELQEWRSMKGDNRSPLCMQVPSAATLRTMCPTCEKNGKKTRGVSEE